MNSPNEYPYPINSTISPNSLQSASFASQNKVTHNSNQHTINDDFSNISKNPSHPRKDLFRAYLDVRQHSSPFEKSKANYLSKMGDNDSKPCNILKESTGEYFSGGLKGIHSSDGTLKMIPRPTREQPSSRLPSSSWFSCDSSTLEEIDLKRNDIRSSYGKGKEAANLSAFQFARLSESLTSDEQNKENLPEIIRNNVPDTFDNIFGSRYDEKENRKEVTCNETQNNHIDYQPRKVNPAYDGSPIENEGSKELYRMAQNPARCAMWREENERSRRVMNGYEDEKERSEYDGEDYEDDEEMGLVGAKREVPHRPSRIEESRITHKKASRNALLNTIEDPNSFIKKVPHKNAVVAKESKTGSDVHSSSNDPFDTKSWFRNHTSNDEISDSSITPSPYIGMDRMGRHGRVVPSSDPLSVTKKKDPCNSAGAHFNHADPVDAQDDRMLDTTWNALNNMVKERIKNVKPVPSQGKGFKRSECTWFRDKHVYNRDGNNNFKPECRYSFSCINQNADSNGVEGGKFENKF